MKLLIDFGNTRLKWATLTHGRMQAGGVFAHLERPLAAALRSEWSGLHRVEGVLVASVVGAAREEELAACVRERFHLDAQFLRSPAVALGVRNAYTQPQRLGVDRFLGLVALQAERARAQVLVSVGTALTIDALAADGTHRGGLIVASPRLMREALLGATARVGTSEGQWRELPHSTADAVFAGALYAAAGAVDRFRSAAAHELGAVPALLLTGGGGDELTSLLPDAERVHDLVLRGLALWAADADSTAG